MGFSRHQGKKERGKKMKMYQVQDPLGVNTTDWFFTVSEARKNAFKLDYCVSSKVIEAKIVGHDAMATTIKNLLNHEWYICGTVKEIRKLGSDKQVEQMK